MVRKFVTPPPCPGLIATPAVITTISPLFTIFFSFASCIAVSIIASVVSSLANAIYDGTDAIMLSGETAAGKYPIEAVKMMAEIAIETEQHLEYTSLSKARMISTIKQKEAVSSAISYSAVATAQRLRLLVIANSCPHPLILQ